MSRRQTQNICIPFIQSRPNVFEVGPTLYTCFTNVLCLLGRAMDVVFMLPWKRPETKNAELPLLSND